jgi:folate-binding protein YgfZ
MATHAPIEAYAAATTGAAYRLDAQREQLRISGPDRVSFLQGMVTNDIESLGVGESCAAALLTAKGALVGLCRVLKLNDALVLDVQENEGKTVRAFLEKYLISEEALIEPDETGLVLSLVGPLSTERLALLQPEALVGPLVPAFAGMRELLIRRTHLESVKNLCAELPVLSDDVWNVLRVEAGAPLFGVDVSTTTIPLEAGLDHAIAYKKGCYIGQEVIARATYRGQMNKQLKGLLLDAASASLALPFDLFDHDKKVGVVTSRVQSPKRQQLIGLGFVHRDHVSAGTQLRCSGESFAEVVPLPF